jgi:hypothetical protein
MTELEMVDGGSIWEGVVASAIWAGMVAAYDHFGTYRSGADPIYVY